MIATTVFLLCAATSLLCTILLLRAYRRRRAPLLLWSTVCFLGFAIDNSLLVVDRVLVPDETVASLRRVFSLIGASVLLFALIWEGE